MKSSIVKSSKLLLFVFLGLISPLYFINNSKAASNSLDSDLDKKIYHDESILHSHLNNNQTEKQFTGTGITRFIYLYPTDRPFRNDYQNAVASSAITLKNWYTDQLDGYTPLLSSPVVQSFALAHDASYYGTNNSGGSEYLRFWDNVLNEALPLTGAIFGDQANVWIFFVDAPAGCNQLSGGGTNGIAVMSHNDLRGLVDDPFLDCNGEIYLPFTFPPDRWIGGQGHELGHAYGLPHPPGCDQSLPKCDSNALMWSGFYYGFPDNTYLREDEKSILISGNYVQSIVDAIFNSGFEN